MSIFKKAEQQNSADRTRNYGGKRRPSNQPERYIPTHTPESVHPIMTVANLLSDVDQERCIRNEWTQAKIDFIVDNHNGEVIDALKVKDRECERCMKPVTPRDVQRLPDGTLAHFYMC